MSKSIELITKKIPTKTVAALSGLYFNSFESVHLENPVFNPI